MGTDHDRETKKTCKLRQTEGGAMKTERAEEGKWEDGVGDEEGAQSRVIAFESVGMPEASAPFR